MHRTEADNNIEIGGKKLYTDGPPGTTVEAAMMNALQEEICTTIEDAGLVVETESTDSRNQLSAAIDAKIAAAAVSQTEIDFLTKNLIVSVISNTTADLDADAIQMINSSTKVPTILTNIDETYDITTDLMAGTAEKSCTWYQLWYDVLGTRMMVPDLTGTTDGASANKLVHSGATFVTDLVTVGAIAYNITNLTQTTVTAIDAEGQLSVADDIFGAGEVYVIRIVTVTGLNITAARLAAVYNNSGSNLQLSLKTEPTKILQIQAEEIGRGTVTPASFPNDDTIPQNTEGALMFTSGSFTPKSSTSKILVESSFFCGETSNTTAGQEAALFIDGQADALVSFGSHTEDANAATVHQSPMILNALLDSWGLETKTFTIRLSQTNSYNYMAAGNSPPAAKFSTSAVSLFKITEYEE